MQAIRIGGLELRFLQTKEGTGGGIDLFEMAVAPQVRMPVPHYHESWDETVYGLSGLLTFTVDGEAIELRPGQSLFIRRGVVHGFDNRGDALGTCLVMLTPGVLGPRYFEEVAALAAGGAPDPAAMAAVMRRHGLVPVPG